MKGRLNLSKLVHCYHLYQRITEDIGGHAIDLICTSKRGKEFLKIINLLKLKVLQTHPTTEGMSSHLIYLKH